MRETFNATGFWAVLPKPSRFLPRGLYGWLGGLVSVALIGLAVVIVGRVLAQLSFTDLVVAVKETPGAALLRALLLTGFSYFALIGYDLVALRQIRARAPLGAIALASFASSAFSFTLGFPLLTGAAVRYWIYVRAALTARQVANITLLASFTFWFGMASVLGAGLFLAATPLAAVNHLPPPVNFCVGAAMLGALVFYCVWASRGPRSLRLFGRAIELPGPDTTLMQFLLGVIDIGSAAATLYVLLPQQAQGLGFPAFAAIYVFAALVGAISHAPGGVGVFEAVMLGAVSAPSQEALLAALVLFRAIYYFIPFAVALILLGAQAGAGRWSDFLDAFRKTAERRGAPQA